MNRMDLMHAAFEDELEKIAGHLRIGRRPISASNLIKKGTMVKRSMNKVGSVPASKIVRASRTHPFVTGAAAGAAALHVGKKMNEDRKLGRQVRLQSKQGY